jgi:hypothetical protein
MITQTKPFALMFAALAFISLWGPTLSAPAQARAASVTLPVLA